MSGQWFYELCAAVKLLESLVSFCGAVFFISRIFELKYNYFLFLYFKLIKLN